MTKKEKARWFKALGATESRWRKAEWDEECGWFCFPEEGYLPDHKCNGCPLCAVFRKSEWNCNHHPCDICPVTIALGPDPEGNAPCWAIIQRAHDTRSRRPIYAAIVKMRKFAEEA